jgi:hypothetical protein
VQLDASIEAKGSCSEFCGCPHSRDVCVLRMMYIPRKDAFMTPSKVWRIAITAVFVLIAWIAWKMFWRTFS